MGLQDVGKEGQWGGERKWMPGLPAYAIFPLSVEDRNPKF